VNVDADAVLKMFSAVLNVFAAKLTVTTPVS
jgi:hypothetical protein